MCDIGNECFSGALGIGINIHVSVAMSPQVAVPVRMQKPIHSY